MMTKLFRLLALVALAAVPMRGLEYVLVDDVVDSAGQLPYFDGTTFKVLDPPGAVRNLQIAVDGTLSWAEAASASVSQLDAPDGDPTGAVSVDNAGAVTIPGTLGVTGLLTFDPDGAFGVTTGLRFGDGDTGFYESADDTLYIRVGGTDRLYVDKDWLIAGAGSVRAGLANINASGTVPTVIPDRSDSDTGIGQYDADALSLIAGGVEAMRLAEDTGIIAISAPGTMTITGVPTAASLAGASLSINPATAPADGWLFSAGVGGTSKFSVDEDGDVLANASLQIYAGTSGLKRSGYAGGNRLSIYNNGEAYGIELIGGSAPKSRVSMGWGSDYGRTLDADLDQDDVLIKRDVDGASTYIEAGSLLHLWRDVTNATATTGNFIEMSADGATPGWKVDSAYNTTIGGTLAVGGASGAADVHMLSTNGKLLLSDTVADSTFKYSRIGTTHYDNTEEPFYFINAISTVASNTLSIGGGYSQGNSAEEINFYTAASHTTTNGTLRATIGNTGLFSYTGLATFTGVPTAATLAGASLSINPATATAGYYLQSWGVGGTDYAHVTAEGNVYAAGRAGIGTNATSSGLTVLGPIELAIDSSVTSYPAFGGGMYKSTSGGVAPFDASHNLVIQSYSATALDRGIYFVTGGTPALRMSIRGSDGLLSVSNNATIGGTLGVGLTTQFTAAHIASATAGEQLVVQTLQSAVGQYTGLLLKVSSNTLDDLYQKAGMLFERTESGGNARGKLHIVNNIAAETANADLSDAMITLTESGVVEIPGNATIGGTLGVTGETTLSDTLTLSGDARVYQNEWTNLGGMKAPGTSPATFVDCGISGAWEFTDGTDDTVVATIRLPKGMDLTVAPILMLGWSSATADPGDDTKQVVWQVEYSYRAVGESMAAVADATVPVTTSASTTANGLVVSEVTMAAPASTDQLLLLRIKRLGADGDDDLGDDVSLSGCGMKYAINKLGAPL